MEETQYSKKHLTATDRLFIEDSLNRGKSIIQISKDLSRSISTISREIRKNLATKKSASSNCARKSDCNKRNVCNRCVTPNKLCKYCYLCVDNCIDYLERSCDKLNNAPYVCNSCNRKSNCSHTKKYYRHDVANTKYSDRLKNSRTGFNLTDTDIAYINETIAPLVDQGQSIYHIMQVCKESLPVSESTIRRLINECKLSTRNIDLIQTVNRKPRKKQSPKGEQLVRQRAKIGHLWSDYQKYVSENPDEVHVEMDCVEGALSDRCAILTLYFSNTHIQLFIMLNEHTSEEVIKALDKIENALGTELFKEMFPIIVTDNGHEFANVDGIEHSVNGGKRTKVYYCEAYRSNEKGGCERNHEFIRRIIPKGHPIDCYDQSHMSLMQDHINSYKRHSLGNSSPYEAAKFFNVNEDFFILLGLTPIKAKDVILKPDLLKNV